MPPLFLSVVYYPETYIILINQSINQEIKHKRFSKFNHSLTTTTTTANEE